MKKYIITLSVLNFKAKVASDFALMPMQDGHKVQINAKIMVTCK